MVPLENLSKLLYTFTKVRGAKVISRFLENEPKYLHSMLFLLSKPAAPSLLVDEVLDDQESNTLPSDTVDTPALSWETRYILLLWTAHLMLTPFDLTTVSDLASKEASTKSSLPQGLALVVLELLNICGIYVQSSSTEQSIAATTLVKLVLRPDMRRLGLHDVIIQRSLASLAGDAHNLHLLNGQLMFLSGIVSSANADYIVDHLLPIYRLISSIFHEQTSGYVHIRSSAVSKKLASKIQRNITVHILKHEQSPESLAHEVSSTMLQEHGVLEDVIDYLLKALADRDTQVRLAASKALSVVATKLDKEMSEEVVAAVLGSLNEDVFRNENGENNTSAVNAVRWHGLTLTLSHMLFRRSAAPEQLADVLKALFNTLAFEQRSATGNSLGSNVRDAANFGLWSLARRYSTKELLQVDLGEDAVKQSAIQTTACHLLIAACFDPAGNIRRGSSAALQELIGRHPDMIVGGIPLVQIVDYHAVGLRDRAMLDVAYDAARLSPVYQDILLGTLHGWRGIRAPDTASRLSAATSLGRLVNLQSSTLVAESVETIITTLRTISSREVEWRHGLILALASILGGQLTRVAEDQNNTSSILKISRLWELLGTAINLDTKTLTSPSMKSNLTIQAIIALMNAIASCALRKVQLGDKHPETPTPTPAAIQTLKTCLSGRGTEEITALPETCQKILLLLDTAQQVTLVQDWLSLVAAQRNFGVLVALGSIYSIVQGLKLEQGESGPLDDCIMDVLILASLGADIETRVVALRGLALTLKLPSIDIPSTSLVLHVRRPTDHFIAALQRGLNDYTINERGDIGSLARFQALLVIEQVWQQLQQHGLSTPLHTLPCITTIQRLSLERLDKVRLQAAKCLWTIMPYLPAQPQTPADVSSYEYFLATSTAILRSSSSGDPAASSDTATQNPHQPTLEAFLTGISSSCGAGADSLMITARQALHDVFLSLPLSHSAVDRTAFTSTKDSSRAPPSLPSLPALTTALTTVLQAAIASTPGSSNDRLLLPLLGTVSFLLDAHLLHPVLRQPRRLSQSQSDTQTTTLTPLTLLSLTQKAHYKSTSVPKLLVCVDIYRCLGLGFGAGPESASDEVGNGDEDKLKQEVKKKLASMLLHPFPRVRMAVAEALWVIGEIGRTEDGAASINGSPFGEVGDPLLEGKWTQPVDAEMKAVVKEVKLRLGV